MKQIHKSSDVQSENIGKNTSVWQFCVILGEAIIGRNCNINSHVFVENDVIIGDNVTIKSGVQIWDGVRIENNVFIGPNVTFTNDIVPRSKQYPEEFKTTLVKEGASIGANSTIIAGHTVGKFAFIGAGSVITSDVPPYSVFYGNPARHKGYITKGGTLLDLEFKDKEGIVHEIEDLPND